MEPLARRLPCALLPDRGSACLARPWWTARPGVDWRGRVNLDELPPVIAGRFRPVRHLGEGGMGTVFVVEHLHTGEQLAMKVLRGHLDRSAQAIERFKREARAFAQIRSEHVVRIIDADLAEELGGARFLVMELLEGKDLEQHTRGAP